MKVRIRGPSGQSAVTLDDDATIETLRRTIAAETSLSDYDVKYSYPPKALLLDRYAPATLLRQLDVRLNGEQLIVSRRDISTTQTAAAKPQLAADSVTGDNKPVVSTRLSGTVPSKHSPLKPPPPSTPASSTGQKSAPLALNRKKPLEESDVPEVLAPELGGTLVLRIMPDDNSCLFRAFASAAMSGLDTMTELRSMIAQVIQANPEKYTKAVLDNQNPDDYCRWIQTEDAWGGQIELDILSRQFDVEIWSIDVQRLRVDRYNEEAPKTCILVYSGIHYDTIALSLGGTTPDEDIKVFDSHIKDEILPRAVELCQRLKEKHYYTDTAGFSIKCNDCGANCIGEAGAQAHAKKTGHYNFGEA